MTFGESFGTCMRKYADFSGRARRSEFWWFYLAVNLIMVPFMIAFGVIFFLAISDDLIDLLEEGKEPTLRQFVDGVEWENLVAPGVLLGVVGVLLFIPLFAAIARRMHDLGLSGWLAALWLVPYLGSPAVLIMCILDGQARDNLHGPDPKAGERPLWGRVPEAPPPLGG